MLILILDATKHSYLELPFGCGLVNSRDFTIPLRWVAVVFGKDVRHVLCLTEMTFLSSEIYDFH